MRKDLNLLLKPFGYVNYRLSGLLRLYIRSHMLP